MWLEVQFGRLDSLLALVDNIEETFKDLKPIFCRKFKFMDMKPMKGKRALDRAMWIDAEAELADLQSIKPQEIKLMKLCQGLKDDRLYEKNTQMDPRGWEEAKTIIRKHTVAASLKADLENKSGSSGHVVNSISGTASKSPSHSPGQKRRYDNEHRGRNRTPQET